MKCIGLAMCLFLFVHIASAQEWTPQDSLKLDRILHDEEELHLNRNAIEQIDLGSGIIGGPMISTQKQWLLPDETLPTALPNELSLDKRQYLTLRPYTGSTPYDWDPIRQKKINVNKDTWRNDPFYHFKTQFIYSNWAKTPLDKGVRNSIEEIEASGLRYNPLANRSANAILGGWQKTSGPTGLDLMTPFTKDFWNRNGRKRRIRTLEVLSQYGDSATTQENSPIIKSLIR